MPAGYRASVRLDGSLAADRYWDALPGSGPEAEEMQGLSGPALRDFAVRRTRELLEDAVEKRMMSDVPFGVLLSGGIDSSTNVALMRRHLNLPVRTFTVGFSDHPEDNELTYARLVAKEFGTEHHEVLIDEKAMREYVPALVYSQEEPLADWACIPLYFVSKLVRDSGTVVVQVGEGSDEQFCGYRSYMAYLGMYRRYWRPFSRFPGFARRGAARAAHWMTRIHDRHDLYLDVVFRAGLNREPFWSGATALTESRKGRVVDRGRIAPLEVPSELERSGLLPGSYATLDSYEIVRSFFRRLDERAPGRDLLTRMAYSEFKLRLPELLLMRVDKIGMSVSIEPRVPFLDHKLVEFTMNLPMEIKVEGGIPKALLKRAVRGLIPDEIVDRKKAGFAAPMRQWILRGDFGRAAEAEIRSSRFFERFPARREAVLDMLRRHRSGPANFFLPVWTFYNAIAWFDHWVDGRRQAQVA
jgi:asparagine synthase (glutamine-hydrolysing)